MLPLLPSGPSGVHILLSRADLRGHHEGSSLQGRACLIQGGKRLFWLFLSYHYLKSIPLSDTIPKFGGGFMATKNKQSKMLTAVHEAASGLYKAGIIDKRRMEKYNLLCNTPVPAYSPKRIKALRARYHISQAVLAAVINTSLSTVRCLRAHYLYPHNNRRLY